MGNMTEQTAAEWLAEQFEYEYCAECGGDEHHHTAVGLLGNWFARCDYAPSKATGWDEHPVIKAYKANQEVTSHA